MTSTMTPNFYDPVIARLPRFACRFAQLAAERPRSAGAVDRTTHLGRSPGGPGRLERLDRPTFLRDRLLPGEDAAELLGAREERIPHEAEACQGPLPRL